MVDTELLTLEEKRQLVRRIAESDLFRRAPKLREFLLYAAECTLENRLDDVRGQAIAEKVFHRNFDSYDADDTIVRAEARNLRKRLESYFETEGADESFVVIMPKGGYSLAFRPRSEKVLEEAQESKSTATVAFSTRPAALTPPRANVGFRSIPQYRFVGFVCICLAIIAGIAIAVGVRLYPANATASNVPAARPASLPFSVLFDNRHDTFIVTSDTAFLKISELSGRSFTLNDYLTRNYPDVPHLFPPDLIRNLNWSEFTDASETKIAGLIMRKNAPWLQRAFLRSGRQLPLSDFNAQNVILLGSPVSNPWAELYSNQLNFQFARSRSQGIQLRNRSPRIGEASVYPAGQNNQLDFKYAQIAFIPSSSSTASNALLVAGTTAEATEAAGEFLLDDAALSGTLLKIGIDPKGPPSYWELILRATTFVGGATHSEVIISRTHPYSVE